MVAYFEKDKYCIGSKAIIIFEIDNSNSDMNIKSVKTQLEQLYSFKAEQANYNERKVLQRITFPGIGARDKLVGSRAQRSEIMIQGDLLNQTTIHPSTNSRLINCTHFLNVELELDACCYCSKLPSATL